MKRDYACVLDFGSSKITAMIGERGVNNTFNIRGTGEVEYAGFYDGEFVEVENLYSAIESTISKAQTNSGVEISSIFVGVPAEFSYVETKSASLNFNKRTKIGSEEIYSFFDMATETAKVENNVIINRSPVHFMLDDNIKCMDPKGQVSSKLSGLISFVYAENKFVNLIDKILKNMNIENIIYVSSALSESIYILDPEVRDTGAILIDCGYITTSVAFVKGDGLVGLDSFSLGGGHITADLSEVLKTSFKDAEVLKRKVVLSLDASDDDFYEITESSGTITPVSAKLTNEIVGARMDMIASYISKSITSLKGDYSGYLPIYLTGGGICYLKGGKDYLSKSLGANIEVVVPQVPQLNRPHFSSVLGLLDLALNQVSSKKLSFKERLKKLFKK
ncbi:MAG: hypothetical protein KBT30_00225 [Clostridiales bacterium]|nr:hypothetical protein [Candidatus Apopatousia equi]